MESFFRNRALQVSILKTLVAVGVTAEFIPEAVYLFPDFFEPLTDINLVPCPEPVNKEFKSMCERVGVKEAEMSISTWRHPQMQFYGGTLFSQWGARSILLIPALYFTSYEKRRSAGSTYLTLFPVNWNTEQGRAIEDFAIPNFMEVQAMIASKLFHVKYHTSFVCSVLESSFFVLVVVYLYKVLMLKGLSQLILPLPLMTGLFFKSMLHLFLERYKCKAEDWFLQRNFPELVPYMRHRLVNYLMAVKASVVARDHKMNKYERVFHEPFSVDYPATILRANRMFRFERSRQ